MQVEFRPVDGATPLRLDYEVFNHLLRRDADPAAIRPVVGTVPAGFADLVDALRDADLTVLVDIATAPTRRRHRFAYGAASGAALIAVSDNMLRLVPASRAFAASGLAQAVSLRPFPAGVRGPSVTVDGQTLTDVIAQDRTRRSDALERLRSELAWRIRAAGDHELDFTAVVRRDVLLTSGGGGAALAPTSSSAVFRQLTRLTSRPGVAQSLSDAARSPT